MCQFSEGYVICYTKSYQMSPGDLSQGYVSLVFFPRRLSINPTEDLPQDIRSRVASP
jgi:hypothetical protein